MDTLPSDLKPLPTRPYDQRPDSLPLDVEECRTALWRNNGIIADAAAELRVTSSRLRAFVKSNSYLQREMEEASERIVDKATRVVVEALDSNEPSRSDPMARYVLDRLGKDRGFTTSVGRNGKVKIGDFTIEWLGDNESLNGDVIDGEVITDDVHNE